MTKGSVRWAMFFANVGHTLTHLMMLLYPTVVLTLEKQITLSYGELMWLSVPGLVLYGFAALPAGWLGDRWSAEQMMVLFFIGSGIAGIATGLGAGAAGHCLRPRRDRLLRRDLSSGRHRLAGAPCRESRPNARLERHLRQHRRRRRADRRATLAALYGWRAAFLVPGRLSRSRLASPLRCWCAAAASSRQKPT